MVAGQGHVEVASEMVKADKPHDICTEKFFRKVLSDFRLLSLTSLQNVFSLLGGLCGNHTFTDKKIEGMNNVTVDLQEV